VPVDETSQPIELLLAVHRDTGRTLGTQIEERLREAIRGGALQPGARVPSTRDLARQLGISRNVVVNAYEQLAAEGYLYVRQGARPRVSATTVGLASGPSLDEQPAAAARFDFRPSSPDVSTFPRAAWIRSLRTAISTMSDADLGYGDTRGVVALRSELASYLGRVRGVVADVDRVVVTSGYTQGLGLVCRALRTAGARRIALETPGNPEDAMVAVRAGLKPIRIGVDSDGMRIDELERADVDAVVLTPAHQHPTGVVLTGERRAALLAWLGRADTVAIEDDYDAEYRYDRAAVGALQGLDPDRIVYAGSLSKTLAPALRLGWLVVPPSILEAVTNEKLLADRGTARIEQLAFADFLARGDLDRHLRRMRTRYRKKRDALIRAVNDELPDARVRGIAAGLHVTVELMDDDDEQAIHAEARSRRIEIETMAEFRAPNAAAMQPSLVLGYAQMPEATIQAGVHELAAAVHATRARSHRTP
jgi:GntR family transcriptional regulator / MocR family aminotransferase